MKKRLLCLFLCSILVFLSACNNKNSKPDPGQETSSADNTETETEETTLNPRYERMSLEEKLIDVNRWEKEGHPQNLMIFDEGGTGLIKNYGIFYKMDWVLEDDLLITHVEVQKNIVPETTYKISMLDNYFILTNTQTDLSSKFYFEGTQSTVLPKEGKKDENIIGRWIPEDESLFGYEFSDDEGKSGKFSPKDKDHNIVSEFKWTVYDYQIFIYFVNGPQYVYEYMVTGNTLIFYRPGKSNLVYNRIA